MLQSTAKYKRRSNTIPFQLTTILLLIATLLPLPTAIADQTDETCIALKFVFKDGETKRLLIEALTPERYQYFYESLDTFYDLTKQRNRGIVLDKEQLESFQYGQVIYLAALDLAALIREQNDTLEFMSEPDLANEAATEALVLRQQILDYSAKLSELIDNQKNEIAGTIETPYDFYKIPGLENPKSVLVMLKKYNDAKRATYDILSKINNDGVKGEIKPNYPRKIRFFRFATQASQFRIAIALTSESSDPKENKFTVIKVGPRERFYDSIDHLTGATKRDADF